jgi:hypothetical protein
MIYLGAQGASSYGFQSNPPTYQSSNMIEITTTPGCEFVPICTFVNGELVGSNCAMAPTKTITKPNPDCEGSGLYHPGGFKDFNTECANYQQSRANMYGYMNWAIWPNSHIMAATD